MPPTAAERIIWDDAFANQQGKTLDHSAEAFRSASKTGSGALPRAAFGTVNGFLAAAINDWASQSAEVLAEAAELSERMTAGVSSARTAFSELEQRIAAECTKAAEGL